MKRLLNIRDATKELNILRSLDSYKRPFELLGTYRLIDDGRRPEATVSIMRTTARCMRLQRASAPWTPLRTC